MSSKKESAVQLIAGVLGIVASAVALQDWYGKRQADAPEHPSASASMVRLHKPGKRILKPIAEPEPRAADAPAPSAPRGVPAGTVSSLVQGGAPVAPPVPATATSPAGAASPSAGAPPPAAPAASAGDGFLALVNASGDGRTGLAAAVRGEGAARLLSGLEQRGVTVLRDVFRGGFVQSAYFSQLLSGNGSELGRSRVVGAGGRVLVGEMQPSCQAAGLVVCDLSFRYVVFDARGSRIARGTITATDVTGDDRASALDAAVAVLLEQHGATLAREAGR